MADLEKVIKGLECCLRESEHIDDNPCKDCPYYDVDSGIGGRCMEEKDKDAIELLKEQDKLLRKKQKDIDKLCCDIADLKHRFHEKTEIVRCKDCIRWLPMNRFHEDYHPGRGDCEWMRMVTDSDWFCSEGKKRSD